MLEPEFYREAFSTNKHVGCVTGVEGQAIYLEEQQWTRRRLS